MNILYENFKNTTNCLRKVRFAEFKSRSYPTLHVSNRKGNLAF